MTKTKTTLAIMAKLQLHCNKQILQQGKLRRNLVPQLLKYVNLVLLTKFCYVYLIFQAHFSSNIQVKMSQTL